jgi:hypothetical protein
MRFGRQCQRAATRRCVNELSRCIERGIYLTVSEREAWKDTKEKGLDLFAPELSGSYDLFNARPLSEEVLPILQVQVNSEKGGKSAAGYTITSRLALDSNV